MRFLPREEKFFHFFLSQSKLISEAAALLVEGCRNDGKDTSVRIAEIEKEGDKIIHEVFHRLNVTFITPIDPEDIYRLAANLDDVLDGIEKVAHKMQAYRVMPASKAIVRLTEIVHGCALSIHAAMLALSQEKPVLEHCIEVNRLEEEAEQLCRKAIVELFDTETNPIQVIKMKEIYELLEMTTDRCEDVAGELENVVVKNS
jgi:uncharacterized protein